MTEIEQAKETIKKISDLDVKLHLNIRQYDLLTALESLKEKAEREKGCEWCDDHNYKQPSEWIWGERIHIIKPHYFCVGDGIAHYEEAEYCPKCGKWLVSKNDIE